MAKAPKKQKQTKNEETANRRVVPGSVRRHARAALREELDAHVARYRDPADFAAETG